ncbi:hypothetical protein CsSME_00004830 [Camellia sinensis var. sinensis]
MFLEKKISKSLFSLLHINQSLFLSHLSFSIIFSLTLIYSTTKKYQIIPNSKTIFKINNQSNFQIF